MSKTELSRMEIDPSLRTGHEGVYEGLQPWEALGRLASSRVGLAIFSTQDLEIVAAELGYAGYLPNTSPGTSTVGSNPNASLGSIRYGELHRHDDESIILHRTLEGSGAANFYWPKADDQELDPGFEFNPNLDEIHLSARNVPLGTEQFIVFPANTWHEFGTTAGIGRRSQFRHYHPIKQD